VGTCLFGHSGSSKMPALMMCLPGKDSPVRKRVVPQSGQKCEVIFLPVSAVLEISFGVPVLCKLVLGASKTDIGGDECSTNRTPFLHWNWER